jgi:hypothetical protein
MFQNHIRESGLNPSMRQKDLFFKTNPSINRQSKDYSSNLISNDIGLSNNSIQLKPIPLSQINHSKGGTFIQRCIAEAPQANETVYTYQVEGQSRRAVFTDSAGALSFIRRNSTLPLRCLFHNGVYGVYIPTTSALDGGSTQSSEQQPPSDAGVGETHDTQVDADGGTTLADSASQADTAAGRTSQTQSTLPQPQRIAGVQNPNPTHKIIRLAWTFDDGPAPIVTPQMQNILTRSTGNRVPATWFIQRSQLGTGARLTQNLQQLTTLQNQFHDEIAIHSAHPSKLHVSWFPVHVSSGVLSAYTTVQGFITDLTTFTALLRTNNINVSFVRMPGGEITEISAYLRHLNVPNANAIARLILTQSTLPAGLPSGARTVQNDFNTVMKALNILNLLLWGGSAQGPMIRAQSWEAESSGTGLTNDVITKFQSLLSSFNSTASPRTSPASLIILAHDTLQPNVPMVNTQMTQMESLAQSNGVRIEYYTVRDLFQIVRGNIPTVSTAPTTTPTQQPNTKAAPVTK